MAGMRAEDALNMAKSYTKKSLAGAGALKGDPGVGISSVEQTTEATDSGGVNVVTVMKTDGTKSEFNVRNGEKGATIESATINDDGELIQHMDDGREINAGNVPFVKGEPGEGVPDGGKTGQILAKKSEEDNDTEWIDPPEEGVTGFNGRTGFVVPTQGDYTAEMVGADEAGAANTALTEAKDYTDTKINEIVGEGAAETLNTIGEISKAIEENEDVVEALNAAIRNKVDKVTGKGLSTNDYSTEEKNKLNGITESADSVAFTRTLTSGTKIGTLTINGIDIELFCTPDTNTTYGVATTSADGLMSATDKRKLNGIAEGANEITVDSALSSTSTNPLQNKAVYNAVEARAPKASPVFTGSISLGRKSGTTVGSYSLAVGENVEASGMYSHSEGLNTTALDWCSHAEGRSTTAPGIYGHAEGYSTTASGNSSHAEGMFAIASNGASHAEGYSTTASGNSSHAEGDGTTAENYASHASGKFNKSMTTGGSAYNKVGDAYVVGNGTSSSLSNAMRVTYAGEVYALAEFNSSGADYAEYFEWLDGNEENADRVGYFVTLDGEKIRIAEPGDYLLGIVSGMPCIIGNADEDWLGRWERDAFGRIILETVESPVTEWRKVEITDEDGNVHTEMQEFETGETITGWTHKANPEYDSSREYIERKDRKEWSAVGMMGVLSVWDDGSCQVNGYAQVAPGGIATAAESYLPGFTYRVLSRVNENVVKVIFR